MYLLEEGNFTHGKHDLGGSQALPSAPAYFSSIVSAVLPEVSVFQIQRFALYLCGSM